MSVRVAQPKASQQTKPRTLDEVLSVVQRERDVGVCMIRPGSDSRESDQRCKELKLIRKERLAQGKKLLDIPTLEQSDLKNEDGPDSPSSMRPPPSNPQVSPSNNMDITTSTYAGPNQGEEIEILNKVFTKVENTPMVFMTDSRLDVENKGLAADVSSAIAMSELLYEFGIMDDTLYKEATTAGHGLAMYLATSSSAQADQAPKDLMEIGAMYSRNGNISSILSDEDKRELGRKVYEGGETIVANALKTKFQSIITSFQNMVDNFKKQNYFLALKDASLLTAKSISMIGTNTLAAAGVPTTFNFLKLPGGERMQRLQSWANSTPPWSSSKDVANFAINAVNSGDVLEKRSKLSWTRRFLQSTPKDSMGEGLAKTFIDSLWSLDYVAGPHVRIAMYVAVTVLQVLDSYGRNNLASMRKFLAANTPDAFKEWKQEILKAIKTKYKKEKGPNTKKKKDKADEKKDKADVDFMNDREKEYVPAYNELKDQIQLKIDKKGSVNFDEFKWGEGVRFALDTFLRSFQSLRGNEEPVRRAINEINEILLSVQRRVDERDISDEDLVKARAEIQAKKRPATNRNEIPVRNNPVPAAAAEEASDNEDDDEIEFDDEDDDDGAGVGLGNARVVD